MVMGGVKSAATATAEPMEEMDGCFEYCDWVGHDRFKTQDMPSCEDVVSPGANYLRLIVCCFDLLDSLGSTLSMMIIPAFGVGDQRFVMVCYGILQYVGSERRRSFHIRARRHVSIGRTRTPCHGLPIITP